VKSIFEPASIAVLGGGNDLTKPGGRLVWCLRTKGFERLWVVNAHGGQVQDLPTYESVEALPEAPDLAVLSIPAKHVLSSVRALVDRGTRGFIVLSCGFSELDESGRALEQELADTIRGAGATLIGPNSLGVFTPRYVGTFGGPDLDPVPGTIDFISASGSTAAFIMEAGLDRGVHFASLVSVGNSATTGVEDVLAYQDATFEDSPVKAKLLYLESIADPARLLHHARSLRRKGCHVVALKAGTSDVGARAASSHTGAMASKDAAVSALFEKAGVIRVTSKTEMVDVAGLLTRVGAPRGRRVAIVTHAGGPGILLADELSRHGFEVPVLSPSTRARLAQALAPGSATGNPIDFLASGTAEHLRSILAILQEHEGDRIDAVCVIFGSPGLFNIWPVMEVILEAGRHMAIPVYPVLPSVRTAADEARKFRRAGGFFFTDEVELARALALVCKTPEPSPDESEAEIDEAALRDLFKEAAGQRMLDPGQVERLLRAIGMTPPPSRTVDRLDQVTDAATELGYPVVLKVVGPSHKTDVKGVVTDVRGQEEALRAGARLLEIEGARGILLQKQVSGVELIVGASREDRFGHLVMVGLGGVMAEALSDVKMALAPLSEGEADHMIRGIRTQAILDGFRGAPAVDRKALARVLRAIAALVTRFPEVREMDVNPLMVNGSSMWAVDGRVEVALKDTDGPARMGT
jgi:acyl-CoA synthetase (NDP forming)